MPLLDNNSLDDQLLLDGSLSFAAGQFSHSRGSNVPENGLYNAVNMDYDASGGIVTRVGVSQVVGNVLTTNWEDVSTVWNSATQLWGDSFVAPVRDAFYFDSSAAEYIVVADGSNQIKFSSETAITSLVSGSSYSGENVYFAQLTDRLYFCDGVGNLQYITPAQTLTSIGAGRITSVEVTANGSGYTTAPTVTASGGGSGATFTSVLAANGSVSSITVTAQGSGYTSGVILTVQAAPGSGVTATAKANLSQVPPTPKLLISHTNRLFCATAVASDSDFVYVSDLLDGEAWSLIANSIRVGGGDGDPITALSPWFGYKVLVFKERSVWVIEANPSQDVSDWTVQLITNSTGCVAHKTVQQVGNDVFFLSREGVQSLSTIEAGAQTGISFPLSVPVNDAIEGINKSYYSRCSAIYYRNRYILSYPTTAATIDGTLVYNSIQKSWNGTWSGWAARTYFRSAFGGKVRLNFGSESGNAYTWQDYIEEDDLTSTHFTDGSVAYASSVITKSYNFGEKYSDKFGYQVQFSLDNTLNTDQLVYFFYLRDLTSANNLVLTQGNSSLQLESGLGEITTETIASISDGVSIPSGELMFRKSYNLLSQGRFTESQFKITTDSGRLSLHSVKTSAFADTIRPEL